MRDVEDAAHNTTRFVVFSPEAEPIPGEGTFVTSFVFRVRNIPAALYKALGGFATNGVNMTKLESYMIEGEFTATQFYAEVDGHPEEPGCAGLSMNSAISRANCASSAPTRPTRSARWLGLRRSRGRERAVPYSRRITRSTTMSDQKPVRKSRLRASGS